MLMVDLSLVIAIIKITTIQIMWMDIIKMWHWFVLVLVQ